MYGEGTWAPPKMDGEETWAPPKMDGEETWAPPKMDKSPQIYKIREMWKWRDIWCVGSVHIGIFILTCMRERCLRALVFY